MIEKRGGNSWRLTVCDGYDGNGQQIRHRKTVKATNITEARKLYNLFAADVQHGNVAKSGKMSLTQFYEFWKENHALKNHEISTIAYNDQLFTRIKTALGHKKIASIEPKHLLAFYKNLSEPGIKKVQTKKGEKSQSTDENEVDSPNGISSTTPCVSDRTTKNTSKKPLPALASSTVRKYHTLISSLLEKAVKWGLLPYNAAKRVEPPKNDAKPKSIYDPELLGSFLNVLETEDLKHRLWILLALAGGLRREEVFGLEWKNVNFETGTLTLEQVSIYVAGQGTLTKGPKNKSSRRNVSLPPSTMILLAEYKAEQAKAENKLGSKWIKTGRIFTRWNGGNAHPQSFNTWLTRFCKEKSLPHITPHSLRHMAATYLIAGGTDIRTVSGKLGHSKSSTTLNIYSHLVKSAEAETATTMESFLQTTAAKAIEKLKKENETEKEQGQ
jgi:integrase